MASWIRLIKSKDLMPILCQTITWNNGELLSNWILRIKPWWNFNHNIMIFMQEHATCQIFCSGLNELTTWKRVTYYPPCTPFVPSLTTCSIQGQRMSIRLWIRKSNPITHHLKWVMGCLLWKFWKIFCRLWFEWTESGALFTITFPTAWRR